MDKIDREQKKEQLESDTRDVHPQEEIWLTSEVPDLQKGQSPASWKEVSDASDKGFGYAKDGRDSSSQDETNQELEYD